MFGLGNPFNVTKRGKVFVFTGPAGVRLVSKSDAKEDFDQLLTNATKGFGKEDLRIQNIESAFATAAKKFKVE